MLKIKQYVKAQSLEEAYALNQDKHNVILGGMLWLKLQNSTVETAIDLGGLGLDRIEETAEEYRIGAMVSLRKLETNAALNALTQNAMAQCLSPIVGVQFRNLATIGGSIRGKFGFSDPLTLFLALGAELEFYQKGRVCMEQWMKLPADRDVLTHIILPKREVKTAYRTVRNTATDFPVLTCAVCRRVDEVVCTVGARPGCAAAIRDEEGLLSDGISEESAKAFAAYATDQLAFGSNLRGSAEYRKKLASVLIKRCVLAMEEH